MFYSYDNKRHSLLLSFKMLQFYPHPTSALPQHELELSGDYRRKSAATTQASLVASLSAGMIHLLSALASVISGSWIFEGTVLVFNTLQW